MTDDLIRQAWAEGRPALGAFIFTRLDPVVVEGIAGAGYDYICIDTQHGLMDSSHTLALLQALSLGTATPLVRVPALDEAAIGRALDGGALGVIVPMIETPAQAARAVRACRYAPGGTRSFGPVRANIAYGRAYPGQANQRVLCIPMIETAAGVAAADEICAVPGIDAVYVGPTDLSLTYGQAPLLDNDEPFAKALATVTAAARRHHVVPGIHASSGLAGRRRLDGFRMITVATDLAVLMGGFAAELQAARSEASAVPDGARAYGAAP